MQLQPTAQSKILKWSLIIGIVIVLNLFFNYALSLAYKQPVYETFCPNISSIVTIPDSEKTCVDTGGQWTNNNNIYFEKPMPTDVSRPAQPKGYCDPQFSCRSDFESAQKIYDRNVFITLVILGAICVAVGNFFIGNILISIALSLAGVLSFIIASVRYWTSADDLIKVIILAIALLILIWVAIKKFKDN